MDYFNQTPDQIDALVDKGYLQPETASLIKKNKENVQAPNLSQNLNLYAAQPQLVSQPLTQDVQSNQGNIQPAIVQNQQSPQQQIQAPILPMDAVEEMQKNYLAGGIIGARKAGEEVGYYNTMSKEMDNLTAQQADTQRRSQEAINKYTSELQESIEDIKKQKLDPDRLMNKSTGNRITAALAVGLGAFAASFNKTPNFALQIVNDSINRDIQAQQFDLEKNEKVAGIKNSIFRTMMSKYQDETAAQNATRVLMLQKAQLDLNKISARYNSATAQNNAKMMSDQLELQKQQAMGDFYKQVAIKSQVGKPNFDFNQLPKEDRERYVPGFGLAPNKEQANNFQQGMQDTRTAKAMIGELMEIGRSLPGTEAKARATTIMNALTGKLRLPLLGPGAMTEQEYKRLIDTIGDPSAIFQLNSKAKLEQLYKTLDTSMEEWGKSLGFKTGYNKTPIAQ